MTILLQLTVLSTVLVFAHGDTQNKMRVLRTRCIVPDPQDITDVNCYTKSFNRSYAVGNIDLFVVKPLNNLFIHFELFKKTDVKYRPFLMNIKEDYCAFFKNNQGSIYLRLMYQMYQPYSNLNHSCPYSGRILIKDLPMDANILPSIWPAGEYRLDVHVFNFAIKKFTMEFTFELKELRNRQKN